MAPGPVGLVITVVLMWSPLSSYVRLQGHRRLLALKARMEGKGNPKNIQNQLCHSPTVKAITPSTRVERQDRKAPGAHCAASRSLAQKLVRRASTKLYSPLWLVLEKHIIQWH